MCSINAQKIEQIIEIKTITNANFFLKKKQIITKTERTCNFISTDNHQVGRLQIEDESSFKMFV